MKNVAPDPIFSLRPLPAHWELQWDTQPPIALEGLFLYISDSLTFDPKVKTLVMK